ncbi:L-rhamnose/proton symporter RhaT [Dyadobacter sp. CY323]|uniref:L-rhamnose/proton symporter RhaT n=1 Tax=Dyadobacter sp. CY323 TaxID=2907302 RepID=UPI001F242E42|nr:L-rhamnose/proton symporter RhaT [Dyadobacter sp. CY323]MCE6990191.1 L-rhamnose/proton symporter RhaT [Dyadobacter sp. CY323]
MEQLLGIVLHAIGGFSSASFYVPYNKVKGWAWETYWITLGFVAWMIMPIIGGWLTTPDIFAILKNSPGSSLNMTYIFGALWGFGGLLSGLGLRYLGLSLGQSISLGVCAIVGTLVPAVLDDKMDMLVSSRSGNIILLGLLVCLVGIFCCGYAGALKESLLTESEKKESVKEFSAMKGTIAAVFGGIMSACMALAIHYGGPISVEALRAGTSDVFVNTPIFILAMAGGFTTNFIYVMILSARNKSFSDFTQRSPFLTRNYLLALLSGLMWYGQFFFYGMGSTKMGDYDFASWSLHMSSIIIFSNLWGLWLKEWTHVNNRTRIWLWAGIILLIGSVLLIGIGNSM